MKITFEFDDQDYTNGEAYLFDMRFAAHIRDLERLFAQFKKTHDAAVTHKERVEYDTKIKEFYTRILSLWNEYQEKEKNEKE